jgi:hypothetical protein
MAGSGYKFYRDVTSYGAKGDGVNDDTEAINAAIKDGDRCGLECGNTFSKGAIIYFPVSPYLRSTARPRGGVSLTMEMARSPEPTRSAARSYSELCFQSEWPGKNH